MGDSERHPKRKEMSVKSPLSASELAILLKARDEAARFSDMYQRVYAIVEPHLKARDEAARFSDTYQRVYATVEPHLPALAKAQRQVATMQRTFDELNQQARAALEYDASRSVASMMPTLAEPLPPVIDAEKEALRAERDEWRDAFYDLYWARAFGGPENQIDPDELDQHLN